MNNKLLEVTFRQISRLAPNKTLLVLHPANWQQHRPIIDRLLKANACYLHLTPQNATLSEFQKTLRTVITDQLGITLKPSGKSAALFAEAIQGLTLVIEGYDLCQDPTIDSFLLALASSIQKGKIVIASRLLPVRLLSDPANDCTAIVPVVPEYMLVDYSQMSEERGILEVRALGAGQALINGRTLDQWDGVLPKCLFYFLVDRAMATRTDIFETFWPYLDKREATNVFHVTKRKVSEIMGQDLTTYASSFYRIADNIQLSYDVVLFQEFVQHAEVAEDDEEAIPLYWEAIRLYKGPFLSSLDQDWINERREELQTIYTEALTGLAHIYRRQGRHEEALGLYNRAIANMPQREDLARILMEMYRDMKMPQHALETYEHLSHVLRKQLKLEPSPEVIRLADTIRKGLTK